jgi:hypothetical protein
MMRRNGRSILVGLLGLLAPAWAEAGECKVINEVVALSEKYTDAQIQRACGEGLKEVSIKGDAKDIIYEIVVTTNMGGRQAGGNAEFAAAALSTATLTRRIFITLLPSEKFHLYLRDTLRRPLCGFEFGADDTLERGGCLILIPKGLGPGTEEIG